MFRQRDRSRRRFEKLLLAAGLLGVAVWLGSIIRTVVVQDWSNWVFERRLHNEPVTISFYLRSWLEPRPLPHRPAPAVPAPPEQPAPSQPKPPAIKTGDLIGRLSIPRLKLHATVREGAGARTLDAALGHIPGTSTPGQPGNVGVAGHRDSLFRGLGNIRKSDRIEFQTLGGNYEYEVESTSIVKPSDVEVLDPGQYPEITLVTCYPFHYVGSAPDRFIVKARLVSPEKAAQIQAPASQSASSQAAQTNAVNQPVPSQAAQTIAASQPKRATTEVVSSPDRGIKTQKNSSRAQRVFFHLGRGQSRTLAPGISMGLEWSDASRQRMKGWMWLVPDRRTIWVSNRRVREPLVFYGHKDGKRRELVITRIGKNSVSGYLQLPGA